MSVGARSSTTLERLKAGRFNADDLRVMGWLLGRPDLIQAGEALDRANRWATETRGKPSKAPRRA